ncbi:hypothetical protein HZS_7247, partial [Henneguya salminicola]
MANTLLKLIVYAKLAKEARRYDEMADSMKKFVLESTEPLTISDRNLLANAYKNVISSIKFSWKSLNFLEENSEKLSLIHQVAQEYKIRVTNELVEKCEDILGLIPKCQARHKIIEYEDQVFYYKMMADYYRYIAEVEKQRPNYDPVAKSAKLYEEAMGIAMAHLVPTNQLRLGLAVNYSVFCFDIVLNHEKACKISNDTFDDAITNIESLTDESYNDIAHVLQQLRDNIE